MQNPQQNTSKPNPALYNTEPYTSRVGFAPERKAGSTNEIQTMGNVTSRGIIKISRHQNHKSKARVAENKTAFSG